MWPESSFVNAVMVKKSATIPGYYFSGAPCRFRDLGLSVGENYVILACVVLTQRQRVTDRQTYGRTTRR